MHAVHACGYMPEPASFHAGFQEIMDGYDFNQDSRYRYGTFGPRHLQFMSEDPVEAVSVCGTSDVCMVKLPLGVHLLCCWFMSLVCFWVGGLRRQLVLVDEAVEWRAVLDLCLEK